MTWTQFTAYLDGTRPIRKEERDELYDQLAALFTGGCSASGYTLNAADLVTVKASNVLTDRARMDGPSSALYRDRLSVLISTASAAFSNYSSAVTTALTGEGITSTERDALLNANVDSWKLWNYYKRLIDALACLPTISVQCRTRSASKTKCGFLEFGSPSSPPKYYRTKTQSGSITDSRDAGTVNEHTNIITYSGALTYASPACGTTDTRQLTIRTILGLNNAGPCDATKTSTTLPIDGGVGPNGCTLWGTDCSATSASPLQLCCGGATVVSSTVATYADSSCASYVGGILSGGPITLTLSDEYTTAQLDNDAYNATAAASWTAYGSCAGVVAFRSYASDESAISMRGVGYLLSFSAAVPSGCKLYYDIFINGANIGTACVNLTGGITSYVMIFDPPAFAGTINGHFANFVLASGAC
jgi:hypothetical protein